MFYRKKPVVIEAIQFTGTNGWVLTQWSDGAVPVTKKEAQ